MIISNTMRALLRNPEFQSAGVRLGIWCFSFAYIGLAAATGHYVVDPMGYQLLFGGFLIVFLGITASIFYRNDWPGRRYFSLVMDIMATSLCIYLTKEAISPFYLLYIWIFLSYGTRYGSVHLRIASVLSVLAYTSLLLILEQWAGYMFEAVFFLLLLVLLPLYQFMLLEKVHNARLEAERSNRAKSAFLSSMTHELRTPLSGILGMANLLCHTPLNEDQKEYINSITLSAQNLDTLIGEVLDLSRVEAAGLELKNDEINLPRFIRDVAMTVSNQALEKELELICTIDPGVPEEIIIDSLRLRQVLLNLLSNGIKFTHYGEVEIMVSTQTEFENFDAQHLLIEVRDTGIGLSEEQQMQVFDRFWQADNSTTNQRGGGWLGGSYSATFSELHGRCDRS